MDRSIGYRLLMGAAGLLILAGCSLIVLVTTGSGLTVWLTRDTPARPTAVPLSTPRGLVQSRTTVTPQPTETAIIRPLVDTATPTSTPPPTEPPTATPNPPSPTATNVSPTEPAATNTPLPTEPPLPTDPPPPPNTPAPGYSFTVAEHNRFPTGKPDFDMFIAVTNADNRPIGGYRVVGNHSAGVRFESAISAGDWTENSGANHYKAGNIKINVPNSPDGVWTLQLLDEVGQSVAAPLEIPFDTSDPAWHFVLFQRSD